jgi:glycosyltransferase involved in cell wall biosynthesis
MKILLAAGLYPPDIGGPARYAQMIVQALPLHGVEVVPVPYSLVRQLPKWCRHLVYAYYLWQERKGVTHVYALDPMSVGLPALLVAKLIRRPFVVRLGGDYAWEQGVQRFGVHQTLDEYTKLPTAVSWPVRLMAVLQRFVVRRASLIVLPSEYLQSIVATWGIDHDKMVVLYSAPSVTIPTESKVDLRTHYGFSGTTIVSIARLTPWKGMKTLIKLMALRQARGEDITLVIGGDGPERQSLVDYAAKLAVTDSVRFLGSLPMGEVSKVVKAADVFLLDTAYEGLSHQLLEVMAIGTPIITTNIKGNTELLTTEVEALLVAVGDVDAYDQSLTRVLGDEALARSMVEHAQHKTAKFLATKSVPKLVTHFTGCSL